MAGFEGLRYADLLRMIIEAAQERVTAENGFNNNNALLPKEKAIPAGFAILSKPDNIKVVDTNQESQEFGCMTAK